MESEREMKKLLNNRKIFVSMLLLVLTVAVPLAALPIVSAHTPPINIPTYSYVEAFPNPIGVGQSLNVFAWLDKFPPTASGEYGDRWHNMTITVGKPDGTTDTLGPYSSDPVGTIFAIYTPTMVGAYTFQFNFPGQTLVGENPPPGGWGIVAAFGALDLIGDYFMPSTSPKSTVTVQQQAIPTEVITPLPTGYWKRPIADSIVGWQSIAGNWLADGSGNPYTTGPETAHILWTKPITFGGVATGKNNDAYYTGLSYEGYFAPPIIISGVLYYNTPTPPMYGFHAVDLRSGEELWFKNGTGPSQVGGFFINQFYPQLTFGQLLSYNSPNQHGYIPYLWSSYTVPTDNPFVSITNWAMYDAFTGNYICTVANVPAGAAGFGASNQVTDPNDGSILMYIPDLTTGTIAVWNLTQAIQNSFPSNSGLANNGYWMWRPTLNGVINASNGFTKNVTLSNKNLPPFAANQGIDRQNGIMLYSTGMATLGMGTFPTSPSFTTFAISIKPDTLGQVLWVKDNPWPQGNVTLSVSAVGGGFFGVFLKETMQWIGFNLLTGEKLWGPSASETPLHMYGVTAQVYNSKLYSGDSIGAGGAVYCYDTQTGNLVWSKESESMGNEGYWPRVPVSIGSIADNKLYLYSDEHSPGPTLEPGFRLKCWDANTGDELWSIPFFASVGLGSGMPVADGFLVSLNAFDNQIYCFGKGQTATMVTANPASATSGSAVLIQGAVTDQSPGAKDTPAIADANMNEWMEYLYQQAPKPNANGVQVQLTATDSSGTSTSIGTATSDSMGVFKMSWTPPSNGVYTITASFAGSKSYYPSATETGIVVSAAAATPSSTSTPGTNAGTSVNADTLMLYLVIATIVIIVAIAIATVIIRRK